MDARTIRRAVNEAERTYRKCWATLSTLKAGHPTEDLATFQYDLGSTLLNLENLYNETARERRDLIERKSRVSEDWFRDRQRTLASYQLSLRETSGLGRSLGDCFAWFFYQFAPDLLAKHLDCPTIPQFPTGEGGVGELSLARRVGLFDGHFLIHHAITSILRLGDFSLFDLKRKTISAVSEIKSKQLSDGQYSSRVSVISRSGEPLYLRLPRAQDAGRTQITALEPMPSSLRERLVRQLKRIHQAVGADAAPTVDRINVCSGGLMHDLAELAHQGSVEGTAIRRIDPCLVAAVVRAPAGNLFSRLRRPPNQLDALDALPLVVRSICTGPPRVNSLHIGGVLFEDSGMPSFLRGTRPLFWSPIPENILRQFYLQELIALVVFNPAALLLKLEQEGFTLQQNSAHPMDVVARRKIDDRILEISGFHYYFRLIMATLMSSDDVLGIIRMASRKTLVHASQHQSHYLKIDLRFR